MAGTAPAYTELYAIRFINTEPFLLKVASCLVCCLSCRCDRGGGRAAACYQKNVWDAITADLCLPTHPVVAVTFLPNAAEPHKNGTLRLLLAAASSASVHNSMDSHDTPSMHAVLQASVAKGVVQEVQNAQALVFRSSLLPEFLQPHLCARLHQGM